MYCRNQAGGEAALEYCSWAQDIIKHLGGKLDKGAEMSFTSPIA
jgi:hypothetical protein